MIRGVVCDGVRGRLVTVEAAWSSAAGASGVPVDVIGLTEIQAHEARVRLRAAMEACGIVVPLPLGYEQEVKARVQVTGAEGCASVGLDLPIALALAGLDADGPGPTDAICIGELSLAGELRPVRGLAPMLLAAKAYQLDPAWTRSGPITVIVPYAQLGDCTPMQRNAAAELGLAVYGARTLGEVIEYLRGARTLAQAPAALEAPSPRSVP